jgi:hypothetical protein
LSGAKRKSTIQLKYFSKDKQMMGYIYHTKHYDNFDVVTQVGTGKAFIVSKSDPDGRPKIGPFNTPAEAIQFGLDRVDSYEKFNKKD